MDVGESDAMFWVDVTQHTSDLLQPGAATSINPNDSGDVESKLTLTSCLIYTKHKQIP
jgi:hypothetical protein